MHNEIQASWKQNKKNIPQKSLSGKTKLYRRDWPLTVPVGLRCNNSTENWFDGAVKEDVAECNSAQKDAEDGTKHVDVSILRLRQHEEFVCDLHRLIACCEPECPELERPQTVYNNKTEGSRDTQSDKVTRARMSKEEQANTTDCPQKIRRMPVW